MDRRNSPNIGMLLKLASTIKEYTNEQKYGFILRSNCPEKTQNHSDILIESKLLRDIRNMVYHRSNKNESDINNYNREDLTVLTINGKNVIPIWAHQQDFEDKKVDKLQKRLDEINKSLDENKEYIREKLPKKWDKKSRK